MTQKEKKGGWKQVWVGTQGGHLPPTAPQGLRATTPQTRRQVVKGQLVRQGGESKAAGALEAQLAGLALQIIVVTGW